MMRRVILALVLGVFLAGCVSDKDTAGESQSTEESAPADMPSFSWIEGEQLAALGQPGRKRDLVDDLSFLQSSGIKILISLTDEPVDPQLLEEYEIRGIHLPVKDFTPPSMGQIEVFLEELDVAREGSLPVAMHCTAGMGRTGTMMATYFVDQGLSAEESIKEIRRLRPGSVETPEQEERVAEFARTLGNEK